MLKLKMHTSNQAFILEGDEGSDRFNYNEVARILREVADKVERGHSGGKMLDANGNSVGEWSLED